jgi:TRAP-type uncharacterized transport system fused permease subunit
MTTKPPRSRALTIIDIVAGVVFALIGAWYMFSFLQLDFRAPHEGFGVPFKIFTVLAWVVGIAVFILFATRKRISFYWPIVGIAAMFLVGIIITSIAAA